MCEVILMYWLIQFLVKISAVSPRGREVIQFLIASVAG